MTTLLLAFFITLPGGFQVILEGEKMVEEGKAFGGSREDRGSTFPVLFQKGCSFTFPN
jgi:hypothetical protein